MKGEQLKKLPPLEKIYEAYSAIADGRVSLDDEHATVQSSNGERKYIVSWKGDTYASDDSATHWQGYSGYPIIAVLMLQERLPIDAEIAARFSDIDWTALNAAYKRDYKKAVESVMVERCTESEIAVIEHEVNKTFDLLKNLDIEIKRLLPNRAKEINLIQKEKSL